MSPNEKRQAILEAAAAEFVERGYSAATLSSVAGRLGLTKGALAHHFPAKDALLEDLGTKLSEAIAESDRITREAFSDSGLHAAVAYLVQLGAFASRDVCVASSLVLLTDRGAPPNIIAGIIFKWLDGLAAFLTQAQQDGQVPSEVNVDEFAEFMLTANIGTQLMPSRSEQPQNRRKRIEYIRLGLRALGIQGADDIVDEVLAHPQIEVAL